MRLLILVIGLFLSPIHDGLDEQIDGLTKQIQNDPLNASLFHKRGILFFKKENYSQSVRDLEHSFRLDSSNIPILHDLGIAWNKLGMPKYAIEYLDHIPYNHKLYSEGLYSKAVIFAEREQWNLALNAFEKFIQASDQTNPDHFLKIAILFEKNNASTKHLQKIIEFLNLGKSKFGPLPTFLKKQVELLLIIEDYQKAITIQSELIQQLNRVEFELVKRADIYYRLNDLENMQSDIAMANKLIQQLPHRLSKTSAMENLNEEILKLQALIQ